MASRCVASFLGGFLEEVGSERVSEQGQSPVDIPWGRKSCSGKSPGPRVTQPVMWARHPLSLGPCVRVCKMGIMIITLPGGAREDGMEPCR